MTDHARFYCVNFNDETRRTKLQERFRTINTPLHFVDPVYKTDPRLDGLSEYKHIDNRISSIMLQHIDSIHHFLNKTTANYCVVCEDDILISRNFVNDFTQVLETFQELKLDVLLLGYLLPIKLHEGTSWYNLLLRTNSYEYYRHPDHLWGSQMYLLTRQHAQFLYDTLTISYAIEQLDIPYNPDWTLTKIGNRGLVYPMLAIEEGSTKTECIDQNDFHKLCFNTNYDETLYM